MEELKKKYDISDIGASGGSSGQIITLGANGKLGPANKPSYTASEVGAVATTSVGAANGVASLGSDGKVPASQISIDVSTKQDVQLSSSIDTGMTVANTVEDALNAINNDSAKKKYEFGNTWSTKTWNGFSSFSGEYIWSDGDNIYYSSGSTQYVLNKSTSTWSTKTWNGMTSFDGSHIWSDGENIYYSSGSTQKVLDKSTSTWNNKTWSGLSSFYGIYIWSDGSSIYYSSGSMQYVLNISTSTWSAKTWSGLSSFYGIYIWSDGDNVYYSYSDNQYILGKTASTWISISWTGLSNFNGSAIWIDEDIYYSYGSSQYVLPRTEASPLYVNNFNDYHYTIFSSSWSSSTDASGYYTYTLSLGSAYNGLSKINVSLSGSSINTRPTSAEITAYNLVADYSYDNTASVTSITFYAKTKPSTTFYILVSGVHS